MRFIVMHKVNKQMEAGTVDKAVVTNMGAFIQESIQRGVFQNGAGLKPSGTRTRMQFRGNECIVRDGPYPGGNELLAGFAMLEVKSKEEAMEWTRKFARVVGDVDVELGPVTEAWDLGLAPRPQGEHPVRYLMLNMADRNTEAGVPPSAREVAEMQALIDEMKQAGVLLAAEGVQPSSLGVRMQFKGKQRTLTDGPFAESKELIAGFSLIEVPSKQAALDWAVRYGGILGDIEVDVLRLHDAAAS